MNYKSIATLAAFYKAVNIGSFMTEVLSKLNFQMQHTTYYILHTTYIHMTDRVLNFTLHDAQLTLTFGKPATTFLVECQFASDCVKDLLYVQTTIQLFNYIVGEHPNDLKAKYIAERITVRHAQRDYAEAMVGMRNLRRLISCQGLVFGEAAPKGDHKRSSANTLCGN